MFIFLFTDGIAVNSESLLSILLAVVAEEVAKAFLTLYFIRRYADKRYILNGLLIGAGVGAGFAVFETAGYGFYELMETGYYESLVNILVMRGVMAIGGHVVWAAIQGGALMLALKAMGVNFSWAALKEPAFLRFAGLTILMHFIWNSNLFILPLPIIMDLKYILLIIFAWLVIFILVNRGIKEINQITLDYQPTELTASDAADESVAKQIID
ncbi:hypothetical protein AWM75_00580 [Aerococcus urinaehominis]|uniref:PrsW family intramembrane metalloprotease n=2 Tax=Aerococcus urinaehominis TaxID=128944 RepID=A0A0X8FJP4_9LACT|nr:PrsW family glutamic-type intramembrane protease [Aerococcus urinaehominis]AMB98578.1 hypothetical protein AWM75_00580 [Aerococcus urinaehominis]